MARNGHVTTLADGTDLPRPRWATDWPGSTRSGGACRGRRRRSRSTTASATAVPTPGRSGSSDPAPQQRIWATGQASS